jgi:glycosyltransferase involved in cell wall biosynthesis
MSDKKISIVTGTLNRKKLLKGLIANTVERDSRVELVLVDGGSTDGTLEYLKKINHPAVKLIEVGGRSSYPHFMNLGIRNASHEYVCQWNDDVFLVNPWSDIIDVLDDTEVYIFSWKHDRYPKFKNRGWRIMNTIGSDNSGEIVLNYGIYHKNVFRKVGLYNNDYSFYFADGDMCHRAWCHGCIVHCLPKIKVVSKREVPKARVYDTSADWECYQKNLALNRQKKLPDTLEYLD